MRKIILMFYTVCLSVLSCVTTQAFKIQNQTPDDFYDVKVADPEIDPKKETSLPKSQTITIHLAERQHYAILMYSAVDSVSILKLQDLPYPICGPSVVFTCKFSSDYSSVVIEAGKQLQTH